MSAKNLEELDIIDVELTEVQSQIQDLRRKQQQLKERRTQLVSLIECRASSSIVADSKSWENEEYKWSQDLRQNLEDKFKLNKFRPLQLSTINATLSGEHVLLIMSTGGGKSLCFQLPALLGHGLTVVISPLVALMEDQLIALRSLNIDCSTLHQNTHKDEIKRVYACMNDTTKMSLKLLYVTPERVAKSKMFMNKLEKLHQNGKLDRIAIDEVHCCSHWGHDFRPDYKFLNILHRQFPKVPILGLTATATEHVINDVKQMLGIPGALIFRAPLNRLNLFYNVRKKPQENQLFLDDLFALINERFKGQSGIIYCFSRKDTEALCQNLRSRNVSCCFYHADLTPELRSKYHNGWLNGTYKIIIATIAFGMGIDKCDVRFVIHQTMSKSLDNYYQSGRAGRDGKRADCIVYYRFGDIFKQSTMVCTEQTGTQNLYAIVAYCNAITECRRKLFATHFGEQWQQSFCPKMCDTCSENNNTTEINAKQCLQMVYDILSANESKSRVTGVKLSDLWAKECNKSKTQSPIPGMKMNRDICEEILTGFILEGFLKEDFHFTPYSIISYVTKGVKYNNWMNNKRDILMNLGVDVGSSGKKRKICEKGGSHSKRNSSSVSFEASGSELVVLD